MDALVPLLPLPLGTEAVKITLCQREGGQTAGEGYSSLLPLPLGEGRLGGPAVQYRPDCLRGDTNFPLPAPWHVSFTAFHVSGDSRFSGQNGNVRHCRGRTRIDRAAAIPKDAVSVPTEAQARRSVEVFEHVFISELAEGKFEPAGDALDLGSARIDATGLRASTTVVTLLAVKTKSALVERLGHVFGDNTTLLRSWV